MVKSLSNKKLFLLAMLCVFLINLVSAAYMECLVKTSDTVPAISPREEWEDAVFEEDRRANTKQGYIINCKPQEYYSSSNIDPTKSVIINVSEEEFDASWLSWLEPEYDYSNPDCDFICQEIYVKPCNLSCPAFCEGAGMYQQCLDDCYTNCVNKYTYPVITERKYRFPLEDFIDPEELTELKEIACGDTTLRPAIIKNIINVNNSIVYNNWSLKPFEWTSPDDPSCDFYNNLGVWFVNAPNQLVCYPQYDGDRNKVIILNQAFSLYSILDGLRIDFPAGITIKSADLFWDGTITLPTLQENASLIPQGAKPKKVFEIGFANAKLNFDKAVKLTIDGEAGSLVGYSREGENFTEITTVCGDNTQTWADANLGSEEECKIDVDTDLVIWTKHFTEFIVYTYIIDSDGDGINDDFDSCPNTPLGEAVNAEGCSCSEIEIPFRDCPENQCTGENWVIYPEDGYDTCVAGEIVGEHLCEAISSTYSLECDPDDDDDGVLDEQDMCPNTELPESFRRLILWSYGDIDGDSIFETRARFLGPIVDSEFSLENTYGCSCKQILEFKPRENIFENEFGCLKSTLWVFINKIYWAEDLF